jgi:superfamily II DNA or RNA helicase/HKD family nuclease
MALPQGLYEQLMTDELRTALSGAGGAHIEISSAAEARAHLLAALQHSLTGLLAEMPGDEHEQCLRQVELINGLLVEARRRLNLAAQELPALEAPPALLRSVGARMEPPQLGLTQSWLFTAGRDSPALLAELRRELASCDGVDLLMSFITVSGVRKVFDLLESLTSIDGNGQARARLRILTTTYTGATQQQALDSLARLPGCEVKVSLDARRTRLHAKAWVLRRRSGFGAAYIGSANLSGAALTGGLEWTVKLTQRGQPDLYGRACAHFETLWNDAEFEPYNPNDPAHRTALSQALSRERGGNALGDDAVRLLHFLDVSPKPFQAEMLAQLDGERALGRRRNLVVAATGTGKTVVAALDYRGWCQRLGGRPRLLFVAHRAEILQQALRTFREVLRDAQFGQLLADGREPDSHDHLFASIDSLSSRETVARLGAEYWHGVVVDECHRLGGERFDRFIRAVQPHWLLGLTATPERTDGQLIAQHFDARPDGGPTVELRLWQALDLQLLTPFEYFACDDATDLRQVPWDQPGEAAALAALLVGNHARARLVLREWQRLTSDPRSSRALVFCVSVAHAEFMTDQLNAAGLPAQCITGTSDAEQRRSAPQRLASGELCALVTVDLYNEGVDLPWVDTLLMLRPTQSALLFQQQLGRGLRLSEGKSSCLVLDFVGQHREGFRYDRLLSSMTGLSRRDVVEGLEQGFSRLPLGCHVHLQRQTRERVLHGLRQVAQQTWARLQSELLAHVALKGRGNLRLTRFLSDQQLELGDLYRRNTPRSGWTALCRLAGLESRVVGPEEGYLGARLADLLHVDDSVRLAGWRRIAQGDAPTDPEQRLLLQMLAYQIDGAHRAAEPGEAFRQRLLNHPPICDELLQLVAWLEERQMRWSEPLPGLESLPLRLHASYGVREVLTALGWMNAERRGPSRLGCWCSASGALSCFS